MSETQPLWCLDRESWFEAVLGKNKTLFEKQQKKRLEK
jgi:hypothetical protein